MATHHRGITTAVLAVVVLAASGGAASVAAQGTSQPSPAAEQSQLAAIAKASADSARHPYTEADIHFMTGMIAHHSQAIVMSRWAPTHGASPSIQTLAERIINAQKDEIVTMQRWLRDRRQPVPEPGAPMKMDMAGMPGMQHEMLMPGMLTPEQMKELDAARGTEFDRLFLTFMIQHHTGAISMVKDLFNTYGAGQDDLVFKLASDINVDQTTEVARMRRMLAILTIQGSLQ